MMKKTILLYLLILLSINVFAGHKHKIEEWTPKTDSVYSYKWDNITQEWVDPNIQTNTTDPITGILLELVVRNIASGEFISKQLFDYNDKGLRTEQQFIDWKDGEWVNYRRNLTNYSDDDLISDIKIQYWNENAWTDEIWQKNYTYNDLDQLTYFEFYSWKNDEWTLGRYDFWNYNEDNLLNYRLSTYTDGSNYYQIFYTYTDFDEWDVMTAQRWTNNGWENYWKRIYKYDHCGNLLVQVEQRWVNDEWQNKTRTEYYYSSGISHNKRQRIPVCHNGHTIYLPASAVPAHLKHGDCLGRCIDDMKYKNCSLENSLYYSKSYKNPKSNKNSYKSGSLNLQDEVSSNISIYPNPFSDKLTIELGSEGKSLQRIELIDFAGKKVWESQYMGEELIHLSRNNLPDGIYLLRFISDEIRTEKVIIESR